VQVIEDGLENNSGNQFGIEIADTFLFHQLLKSSWLLVQVLRFLGNILGFETPFPCFGNLWS